MSYRAGSSRGLPLPSYSNAIDEKLHLTSRTPSWTTTLLVPIPFRRARHLKLVLPIPQRIWMVTSSRMGRRRAATTLCFAFLLVTLVGYALVKRFIDKDKNWPGPFMGKPPTLVFRKTELQKIWEWEVASGHYPSNKPAPAILGLKVLPPNPSVPATGGTRNGRTPKPPSEVAPYSVGTGPSRRYATVKSESTNAHYPPRPKAGSIADLDVLVDQCDFSTDKYVRDCLEFMRIGAGVDGKQHLRRTNLDSYSYIYVEEKKANGATPATRNVHPDEPSSPIPSIDPANPDAGLVFNRRGELEPPLVLPPPRTQKTSNDPCDPDHPRIYHMFWTGEFTDKPYMALMSYLFTQNLSLGQERGAAPPAGLCRSQFWMWINPGPAASAPNPTALRDMFDGLKVSPWASPFLHRRFEDVIKFKLWNTTEQLDSVAELKDEWRKYEGNLFNSGGQVYKAKPKAPAVNTTASANGDIGDRVGSDSAQTKDELSTILSDLARFILCHRFGGTYLDADTVFLRDWEELWGWRGAFAYRWSFHEAYNTAVLRLNKGSALGSFLFRTALRNKLDFHPMTVWRYMHDAHLEGLLLRLPDALFDSAWLNWEGYQHDRPAFPFFTKFQQFFESKEVDGAAPNMLGFDGFFRGAYSYHFHNFWWMSFDKARNYPDLGARFAKGETRAKADLLRKALAKEKASVGAERPHSTGQEDLENDSNVLSWSAVLKRTCEAYVRGERPNMYGEWIQW